MEFVFFSNLKTLNNYIDINIELGESWYFFVSSSLPSDEDEDKMTRFVPCSTRPWETEEEQHVSQWAVLWSSESLKLYLTALNIESKESQQ